MEMPLAQPNFHLHLMQIKSKPKASLCLKCKCLLKALNRRFSSRWRTSKYNLIRVNKLRLFSNSSKLRWINNLNCHHNHRRRSISLSSNSFLNKCQRPPVCLQCQLNRILWCKHSNQVTKIPLWCWHSSSFHRVPISTSWTALSVERKVCPLLPITATCSQVRNKED